MLFQLWDKTRQLKVTELTDKVLFMYKIDFDHFLNISVPFKNNLVYFFNCLFFKKLNFYIHSLFVCNWVKMPLHCQPLRLFFFKKVAKSSTSGIARKKSVR